MSSRRARLALSVEKDLIDKAKKYAEQHGTSVSQLVTRYFEGLDRIESGSNTPILDRLIGILPGDSDVREHHEYWEQKYADGNTYSRRS
jgi:hypothetical protein